MLIALLAVIGLLGLPVVFVAGYLLRRGAESRPVACGAARPEPAARRTFASPPPTADPAARWTLLLETSCGRIDVALDAARAPRTVGSLVFLAGRGFYDGTRCHRLVVGEALTALQCGDPTGTGRGGPGYRLPEEHTGTGYRRGDVAMARTRAPGTTGSQFFLVARDASLPADYTLVGRITAGLDVLDRIVAIGHDGAHGPDDGAPRQQLYLDAVTATRV